MSDDYTLKDRIRDLGDSISEQFKNIARQLEIIEQKLDGKASLGQLAEAEDRVMKILERHEGRLTDLEKQNWGSAAVSKYQRWAANGVLLLASGGVSALIYLAFSGGHP